MKKTLEILWNEHLSEKCAIVDTDEERALAKKAMILHEEANASLNKTQQDAIEKYIDALSDVETYFAKKAFFKGCEFAVSFLLETKCL